MTPPMRHAYWLPAMAQEGPEVSDHRICYRSYPSRDLDIFMHMRSELSMPEKKLSESSQLKGLKIDITVNLYRSIKVSQQLREGIDPGRISIFNTYNTIRDITKEEYNRLLDIDPDHSGHGLFRRQWLKLKEYIISYRLLRQRIKPLGDPLHVTLSLCHYLRCGVAEFKIENCDSPEYLDMVRENLYHQVKSHFHTDHYHKPGTVLAPSCSINDNTPITQPDNGPLLHYIAACHDTMTRSLHGLYADYKYIDTHPLKKPTTRLKGKEATRLKLEFYESCYNLIGQWVFVQTLLNSSLNTCCRISGGKTVNGRDYGIIANNLSNVRLGVEALRNKIRYHHDEENLRATNRSNRLNTCLAWLSVILGILSVILALLCFQSVKDWAYNRIPPLWQ